MARLTSSKKLSSINTESRRSTPVVEYKKVSHLDSTTRPDSISAESRESVTKVLRGLEEINIHYPSTTRNYPSLHNFPWGSS